MFNKKAYNTHFLLHSKASCLPAKIIKKLEKERENVVFVRSYQKSRFLGESNQGLKIF